jgi:hypothetical protein
MGLAWAVGLKRYGPFSFVVAGIFCFTVYSLPALFGLVFPFTEARAHAQLIAASQTAVHATALAWAVLSLTIAIPVARIRAPERCIDNDYRPSDGARLAPFTFAALCICVVGFLAIAATDGPLFFLEMRPEGSEGLLRMLWRWVNAIGLVAAVLTRSWRAAAVFAAGVAVYFLSGDRTIIVITAFSLFVVLGRGRSWTLLLRPQVILGVSFLAIVAVVGKPIYLAVKLGSAELIGSVLTSNWLAGAVLAFEPFTTFNILELVIANDFTMPVWTVIEGVVGQALLVPSALGIDPNSFNAAFTQEFAPKLRYGIAGNFWAQGWAIGGPAGVAVYAVIYASVLRMCDRASRTQRGPLGILFIVIGALFAVYAHRNALDNLLSFVRQIAIVGIVLALLTSILTPFYASASAERRTRAGRVPAEFGSSESAL